MLGGLVFDLGDKTIDLSVSSRVHKLNALLDGESFVVWTACTEANGLLKNLCRRNRAE